MATIDQIKIKNGDIYDSYDLTVKASNVNLNNVSEDTKINFQDTFGIIPKNHADISNQYGVGTNTNYGHIKISDNYRATGNDTALSIAGANKLYLNNPHENLIDNPFFTIDQRGIGGVNLNTSAQFRPRDRWVASLQGGFAGNPQKKDSSTMQFRMKPLDNASSTGYVIQRLIDPQRFANKTVTFSCRYKLVNSVNDDIQTPYSGTDRCEMVIYTSNSSQKLCYKKLEPTATWKTTTLTVTLPNDVNFTQCEVGFYFGRPAVSGVSDGEWINASENNNRNANSKVTSQIDLNIYWTKLEWGNEFTDIYMPDETTELKKCQQVYQLIKHLASGFVGRYVWDINKKIGTVYASIPIKDFVSCNRTDITVTPISISSEENCGAIEDMYTKKAKFVTKTQFNDGWGSSGFAKINNNNTITIVYSGVTIPSGQVSNVPLLLYDFGFSIEHKMY